MASTWKERPRLGAKAMSCTASVTVINVSALAYFLLFPKLAGGTKQNKTNGFLIDQNLTGHPPKTTRYSYPSGGGGGGAGAAAV